MKTILLGYQDVDAQSRPDLLGGTNVDAAENYKVFLAAREQNKFPKGLVRLEMWTEDGRSEIAICHKAAAEAEKADADKRKELAAKSKAAAEAKAKIEADKKKAEAEAKAKALKK